MKVLITTTTFGKYDRTPIENLQSEGLEVIINPFGRTLSKEEALQLYTPDIAGAIAGTEEISREVISKAKNLKVISRCGIGLDNIDLEEAKRRNIKLFSTSEPVIDAVAELTLCLILSCLRKIIIADKNVRNNIWEKPMGSLLKDKTLGIVGLGNVGKRLVELTTGFNLKCLAYDIKIDDDFGKRHCVNYVSLDSLLSQSDIVSIHLPLTKETKGLFNRKTMSLMKPSAILINTSRAAIIEEDALVNILKQRKIMGVGLDVFAEEPYTGHLTEFNNVVLTPHIGSYAKEARIAMEIEAVKNLVKGLGIKRKANR